MWEFCGGCHGPRFLRGDSWPTALASEVVSRPVRPKWSLGDFKGGRGGKPAAKIINLHRVFLGRYEIRT